MRSELLAVLVVAGLAASPAIAQRSPNVRDVYTAEPSVARLGPDLGEDDVLRRTLAARDDARALRYDVALSLLGAGGEPVTPFALSGTVLIGQASGDDGRRPFRVTLNGTDEGGERVLATLAHDGARYRYLDMLTNRLERGATIDTLGPFGEWSSYAMLVDVPDAEGPKLLPLSDETAVDYRLFLTDRAARRHVYVDLSADDVLPRRVDWVVERGDAGPLTVRLDVVNVMIDPPAFPGMFSPKPSVSDSRRN